MSVPHATYHCLYKYVFTIYVQPFCIYEVNRDRRFYCFFFYSDIFFLISVLMATVELNVIKDTVLLAFFYC